jgi:hypothetical protein
MKNTANAATRSATPMKVFFLSIQEEG